MGITGVTLRGLVGMVRIEILSGPSVVVILEQLYVIIIGHLENVIRLGHLYLSTRFDSG